MAHRSVITILAVLGLVFLVLFFLPFYMFDSLLTAALVSLGWTAVCVVAGETAFRKLYRIRTGAPYTLISKVPFTKMYVEPHPYLPFVYRRHFQTQQKTRATYSLHRDKSYWFGTYRTNNFRHLNGPTGDRDIVVPKPRDLIRINCLGESTTGNYIQYEEVEYSLPLELEKLLMAKFPDRRIEVNNFAAGGYTTAEILIEFLLDAFDTEPDVVVLYHAYNDLGPSL